MAARSSEAFLAPWQAADYARLKVEALYELLETGEIAGVQVDGRWRIRKSVLDAWLDAEVSPEELPKLTPKMREPPPEHTQQLPEQTPMHAGVALMSATPEMTDVLQFMELRAPLSPEAKSLRRNYIYDDIIGFWNDKHARVDVDLQSEASPSAIGRLVYEHVFCDAYPNDFLNQVLDLLPAYQPPCPPSYPTGGIRPLWITELERRAYIDFDGIYYLLPERLEQIEGLGLLSELLRAFEVMETARRNFNLSQLAKELQAAFGGEPLRKIVFKEGFYAEAFGQAKRTLFDTLYLLYILRRRTSVNLEYAMEGLRVLHVLEALAVDELISVVRAGQLSQEDRLLRRTLEALFPELQGWNGSDPLQTLPLIQSKADFEAYFTATPVIHPIFARLRYYRLPFNFSFR